MTTKMTAPTACAQPLVPRSCPRMAARSRLPGGQQGPGLVEHKKPTVCQTRWYQLRRTTGPIAAYTTEAAEPAPVTAMSVDEVKVAFLDSLFGLDRGLKAKGETKAEINELIGQLESCNPTPSPTEEIELLKGTWRLVYSSSPSVLGILRLSKLPLVEVGDITQSIDGPGMSVENRIEITVPFSRTSFGTTATFEVSSPKRLRLQLNSGSVSTPELVEDVELPDSITLMGQNVDLTPLKEALKPLNSTVKDAVAQLSDILSQQQDLKFPIEENRAPITWLLTSFLDEDTRISRGPGGTLNVFVKDTPVEEAPAEVAAEEVPAEVAVEAAIETTDTLVKEPEQNDDLDDEPVESPTSVGDVVVDVEATGKASDIQIDEE